MGVSALHPRTYGCTETNSSIDAYSVQEDGWVIYLKIFIDILVYDVNMLNMGWVGVLFKANGLSSYNVDHVSLLPDSE